MIKWLFQKIVGNKNQREVRRIRPTVTRINEIEEALQAEPEDKLREMTKNWQAHLSRYHELNAAPRPQVLLMSAEELAGAAQYLESRLAPLREEFSSLPSSVLANVDSIEAAKHAFYEVSSEFRLSRVKYLEQILPEAYAVVKNAARRMCGSKILVNEHELPWEMVHFDVQLIGGTALHRGMIAEMQTGEGKTLVATLPVYLNALTGLGVHVITVNDYLARRDSQWMGSLYRFLGLTVGCLQSQMPPWDRREQYACDITYGTNSEFGFDYLRDNGMANSREDQVQRGHYLAVIDEVDSILIDEARTPLIISGPSNQSVEQYQVYRADVEKLFKKQTELCNQVILEAKAAMETGDQVAAGRLMMKVKLGQPRNRQLMRLMEEPEYRRIIEKAELAFYQDTQKKDLFDLKEELYFVIEEKSNDTDLMEKGRQFLSPQDPDSFTLPDLGTLYAEIDAHSTMSPAEKVTEKERLQEVLDKQGEKIHCISQLLKAYGVFEKDVQYVVKEGKVIIVDENTGREMPGRRWSDGLHQAIEAKEQVEVEGETQTLATITIQNYFRLYEKLAGMTGTAETEAAEFHDIYQLDVLPIPTNRVNRRVDQNDLVFKTRREKFNAVITAIEEAHQRQQPVLVGTASVEASETLSRMLKRAKIPHNVLNAKYHEQEAEIVAKAGQLGAVTVSTNMAGRGTDIKLSTGVEELGGLLVVGTERHESRRTDRQLRGRCARQGDPGVSRFFISFEDDLMRNFAASERMTSMMERMGLKEGDALEHSLLNRSVETAQKRVEQRNYVWRKHVLDFDDVMNKQREVVYGYRNEVLSTEDPRDLVDEVILEVLSDKVAYYASEFQMDNQQDDELLGWVQAHLPIAIEPEQLKFASHSEQEITTLLVDKVKQTYGLKVKDLPFEILQQEERRGLLVAIDKQWQDHLYEMDALREGVRLRAQGQKDPLVEYKKEAYILFTLLMGKIKEESLQNLFRSANSLAQILQMIHHQPQLLNDDAPAPVKIQFPKRKPSIDITKKK